MTRPVATEARIRRWHDVRCLAPGCDRVFRACHENARHCSPACRKRASRASVEPMSQLRVQSPAPPPDRPLAAAKNSPRDVYEWPSGLRRMPPGTRLSHDRPYGPFDSREEWLAWAGATPPVPLETEAA